MVHTFGSSQDYGSHKTIVYKNYQRTTTATYNMIWAKSSLLVLLSMVPFAASRAPLLRIYDDGKDRHLQSVTKPLLDIDPLPKDSDAWRFFFAEGMSAMSMSMSMDFHAPTLSPSTSGSSHRPTVVPLDDEPTTPAFSPTTAPSRPSLFPPTGVKGYHSLTIFSSGAKDDYKDGFHEFFKDKDPDDFDVDIDMPMHGKGDPGHEFAQDGNKDDEVPSEDSGATSIFLRSVVGVMTIVLLTALV